MGFDIKMRESYTFLFVYVTGSIFLTYHSLAQMLAWWHPALAGYHKSA